MGGSKEGKGPETTAPASKGSADGKGTDGKSADGKGTDSKGTDGKSADGKSSGKGSKDGKGSKNGKGSKSSKKWRMCHRKEIMEAPKRDCIYDSAYTWSKTQCTPLPMGNECCECKPPPPPKGKDWITAALASKWGEAAVAV